MRLYITDNNKGFESSIGKQTTLSRKQVLSLRRTAGLTRGTILHELGHAIGLLHEQSRPDRDRYITIHPENMIPGAERYFERKWFIDYQGEVYDYASVMHYTTTEFSKNRRRTITVTNRTHYQLQHSPMLGHAENLSPIDVRQINKYYGCYVPESGYHPGDLSVRILEAGAFSKPGHYYVCVSATDSSKNIIKKCTKKNGISTNYPTWDEELLFKQKHGCEYHFFKIVVKWYRGIFSDGDDIIVGKQTIWVESEDHHDKFFFGSRGSVTYRYKIVKNV